MGRPLPEGGARHRHYRRALQEVDPVRRDIALAAAEAAVIGMLTREINNQYGDADQDPRQAHLVTGGLASGDDQMSEAYWMQGDLALSRSYDTAHGWSMTVDPSAEV